MDLGALLNDGGEHQPAESAETAVQGDLDSTEVQATTTGELEGRGIGSQQQHELNRPNGIVYDAGSSSIPAPATASSNGVVLTSVLRGTQEYLQRLAAQSDARRQITALRVDAELRTQVSQTAVAVAAAAREQQERQLQLHQLQLQQQQQQSHGGVLLEDNGTGLNARPASSTSTRKRRAPAASPASMQASASSARKIPPSIHRHASTTGAAADGMPDPNYTGSYSPAVKAEEAFENGHSDLYHGSATSATDSLSHSLDAAQSMSTQGRHGGHTNGHFDPANQRKRGASSTQMSDGSGTVDEANPFEPASKRARLDSTVVSVKHEDFGESEGYEDDRVTRQELLDLGIVPEEWASHPSEDQKIQVEVYKAKRKQEKLDRQERMQRHQPPPGMLYFPVPDELRHSRSMHHPDHILEMERKVWSAIARSNIPKVSRCCMYCSLFSS